MHGEVCGRASGCELVFVYSVLASSRFVLLMNVTSDFMM